MPVLLDTNHLLRVAQPEAPEYPVIADAIVKYLRAGDRPKLCPQNLYEFWSVATRPPGTAGNGLGMTVEEAAAEIEAFESFFPILPDTPAVYNEWRVLTRRWGITGRQAFDARLIATMIAHNVPHLLTLDVRHFRRYEQRGIVIAGQPLRILHPQDV